ncbi:hemolysin protein [Vibrio ishigakensis]|uniref:Hemolysin n=1 Tax=Vibrio ishigakensis TaxID=1481914 RepID=A0A0B8NKN7_9VIBR|nr:DUF333 domain-containing protein [Vibrio ishigakensis]GAM55275.1 hemolysin [Vibrio ishigakensis]GAM59811.1 hemolysin protein [Vibrio ishigakensis]
MKKSLLLTVVAGAAILAGCASEPDEYTVEDWDPITSKASMYCVQEGHDITRANENDQRVTYCEISDEEKTEIWEYYYQNHEDERPENQQKQDAES